MNNIQPPWERLGTKLVNATSVEDALIQANLNFEVTLAPLCVKAGTGIIQAPQGEAIVKLDENGFADKILTIKTKKRTIKSPKEVFDFLNDYIAEGKIELAYVGQLYNERVIWALSKVKYDFTPELYQLTVYDYESGHDLLSCYALNPDYGVLLATMSDISNQEHLLKKVTRYQVFKAINLTLDEFEEYVREVFQNWGRSTGLKTLSAKFLESDYSVWAAFNIVVEYLTYYRGHTLEDQLASLWFKQSYRDNQNAYLLACEIVDIKQGV